MMNETAAIITAVSAVIGAMGLLVAQISKLAPVINALNKFHADQHKRSTADTKPAKTDAAQQTMSNHALRVPLPRDSFVTSIIGMALFAVCALGLLMPPTPSALGIVLCAIIGVTTIFTMAIDATAVILRAIVVSSENVFALMKAKE